MRLFAALDLPRDVVAALEQPVARARQVRPDLRWAPVEQWHLTLGFYASVPDDRVEELARRLRRAAARTRPLSLRLAEPGVFGSARRGRVLWWGVDGDREPLRRLAASCRAAGRRVGLRDPALDADASFRPHVTLARAAPPADMRAAVDALLAPGRSLPEQARRWTAQHVVLVRSDLGRGSNGRARHTVLDALPFRRAERTHRADPAR